MKHIVKLLNRTSKQKENGTKTQNVGLTLCLKASNVNGHIALSWVRPI